MSCARRLSLGLAGSALASALAVPAHAEPRAPSAPALAAPASVAADDAPPASAAPASAAADDDDGGFLELGDESTSIPKLDLYGYADVMFTFWPKASVWSRFYREHSSFGVGNVNLYLDGHLGPGWRSLVEVRFMYLPRGGEDFSTYDGTSVELVDTSAADYGEFNRSISWGGIRLERVWLEWQPREAFAVRVGQFITPIGVWNQDHGSPTIIGTDRPVVIGQALFPESQTGVHAFGRLFVERTAFAYDLTLSNGRGNAAEFVDFDANKAVGGRLGIEAPLGGTLAFGLGVYRGRATNQTSRQLTLTPVADRFEVDLVNVPSERYEELSYGFDLRWASGAFLLQAEYQVNEAVYDDEYRGGATGFEAPGRLAADYRRHGGYALLGYRTPWLGIMPYTIAHHMNFAESGALPPTFGATMGVNVRPTPAVVFKLDYSSALFTGPGSLGVGNEALQYVKTQVAWAF